MKLTNIALYSNEAEVANFSFQDPGSSNPYIANAVDGLDASEIVPKFYGIGKVSKRNYYAPALKNRELVVNIFLNPDFSLNQSYSGLRDDLYKAVSSSRTGQVELRFNNGFITVAAVSGFISKFETNLFDQTPSVKLTIKCNDAMLRAKDLIPFNTLGMGPSITLVNGTSTAPSGLKFSITINQAATTFSIQDTLTPDWEFVVTPGVIGANTGFIVGDILHLSSEVDDKYIYILRDVSGTIQTFQLADKVSLSSVWPVLFPGANDYELITAGGAITPGVSGDFSWNELSYRPAYWGA